MIELLRWLIVIEAIGLAFLPLTIWLLRGLPDRGYAFSRLLGLLLVTFIVWFAGSIAPVGSAAFLPIAVLVGLGGLSWLKWHRNVSSLMRDALWVIAVEEALFIGALIGWSLLRAYVFHPGISHTEQFMDMALLNTSLHSASFPPADVWMSGHTVNYYYFGYLMAAVMVRISGVGATTGYNLQLSMLFALALSGTYAIGYGLTRRLAWSLLAPLAVVLLGNWHAVLVQLPHGLLPASTSWWFWDSTRVVGSAADYTINEFPFFSFMLGDLHPHVMALPVTLLAIAAALSVLAAPESVLAGTREAWLRAGLLGLVVGSLFTINSWDLPTYGLLLVLSVGAASYAVEPEADWWRRPAECAIALGVAALVPFAPFYLHFRSLAHGVGPVSTRTDIAQFLQVFGLSLTGVIFLLASLALLLQPVEEEMEEEDTPQSVLRGEAGELQLGSLPAGSGLVLAVGLALIIGALIHALVLIGVLLIGAAAWLLLERVLNTEQPNVADALALLLVLLACLILAFTEVAYLRDSFDGTASYRMNTVFKFYYQAWTLLGLAAAYGAFRGWSIVSRFWRAPVAIGALSILSAAALGGAVYTVLAPASTIQPAYGAPTLDGMAWLRSVHPGDYNAIRWLSLHAPRGAVELEAVGPDYQYYARISTFTGLPTVMGWVGHEDQWRPGDGDIAIRAANIRTIYTTRSSATARALLRQYGVRYVIVGDVERSAYGTAGMSKFSGFMRAVLSSGGTTVYAW